ncbi:MAG: TIGR01777 family oxidoreductase [Saprospiraceae bacterium]|nr:TIGR01777 family oxidoreductase [Saprospiraceae bacterium]MCB9326223.1 TIGR01777 family protein [Lewinellaceae bacterium]
MQKNVLIAGGSGLVGKRLSELLSQKGYSVNWLSRTKNSAAKYPAYEWDLEKGFIEDEAIQKADYVINLSGASIADKPWTAKRKQEIIASRTESIRLLNRYFKKIKFPEVYCSATAVGYYGNAGNQLVDETTPPGQEGFLPESCILWEEAFHEVKEPGLRTVALRLGIVLSDKGGALEKLAMPFKFFMGNWLGSGDQWYSWIHIDDLCRMFIHALENDNIQGIYNAVAPNPVTNKALTYTLKKVIGKPAIMMPVPEFALRIGMGEMADMVLDSAKISSKKIEKTGFDFLYPDLEQALQDLIT